MRVLKKIYFKTLLIVEVGIFLERHIFFGSAVPTKILYRSNSEPKPTLKKIQCSAYGEMVKDF